MKKITGFTLIEILIVIVIISIVATVGVLTIHVNENKKLETLTGQIVNTLNLAEQESMLRPATLGLAIYNNQLRFYEYHPQSDPEKSPWTFMSNSVLNTISIPNNVQLTLKIDDEIVQSKTPQITISPSGDLTAFTLLIGKKNSSPLFRIIAEDNGNLKSRRFTEDEE